MAHAHEESTRVLEGVHGSAGTVVARGAAIHQVDAARARRYKPPAPVASWELLHMMVAVVFARRASRPREKTLPTDGTLCAVKAAKIIFTENGAIALVVRCGPATAVIGCTQRLAASLAAEALLMELASLDQDILRATLYRLGALRAFGGKGSRVTRNAIRVATFHEVLEAKLAETDSAAHACKATRVKLLDAARDVAFPRLERHAAAVAARRKLFDPTLGAVWAVCVDVHGASRL